MFKFAHLVFVIVVCLAAVSHAVDRTHLTKGHLRSTLDKAKVLAPGKAKVCCKAKTAACLSCWQGIGIEEFCEKTPAAPGCETSKLSVIMQDNFKSGMRKDMWKKLRGGGVDLEGCKSGSPALRFEATDADVHGAPSVTTKSLDLFGGGELEFKLKFCDGTPMGGEFNRTNGVLVQYSADGSKWYKLEAYLQMSVGESLRKDFVKITIPINKKHHLKTATSHTYFKFTQYAAGRGNWAIKDVVIRQAPLATTAEDNFATKKSGVWSYPIIKKGADAYKYKLSKSGIWFAGSANMEHTLGLQRAFTHPLKISATVTKNDKCSSHFIALSRRTNFAFSWGKSPGEVKVGFNCNQRFVYSPWGNKVVKCPGFGDYKLVLVVDQFNIMLTDEEYKCDPIKIDNSPFYGGHGLPHFIFIGADQDKPMKASLFKHFKVEQTEWDAKGRDLGSVLIKDKLTAKSSDTWQVDGKSQRLYVFAPDGLKVGQMGDVTGSNKPMRTIEAFNLPLAITTKVLSFEKSANYYVALSPDPDFQWDIFPNKKALKFEWSCKSKTFLGFGDTVKEAKGSKGECDESKCVDDKEHKLEIKVFPDIITFKDDCCSMLSVPNKWGMEAPVHIFVGSTRRDKTATPAQFKEIVVKGQARPPTIEDDTILMDDNFDFNDDKNTAMWTMSGPWKTTGQVNKKCGATEGSAMVFSSTGTRMATIKPITMPHGAKITFDLKFGGSSVSCAGMIPSRKESRVVLRASTDNGKTWTEIETWKGDDFKYILNDWNNMEFALTKMDYPELSMAGSVLLQFIQPGYNRPCCGHWALDTVRVTSLEIKGEPIFTEAFDGANTAMWNYPSKSKAYTYGFDDGLYFSGDPNTKTTIRTKFTMPQSTIIKATIDKNDACNNHYIAISKSKDLKFFWGTPKNAIYFMWNCNQKYIYAPDNRTSIDCKKNTKIKLSIRMEEGRVVFEDDKCGTMIMPTNSDLTESQYYVYIGAAQDRTDIKARFMNFRVERLPDKQKNFMEAVVSENFEKRNKEIWEYPTLKDIMEAAANAKKDKAEAKKALDKAMDDLEDAGEAVGYSVTNATDSIKRRRAEMKKLEATDKEYMAKQRQIDALTKTINVATKKLKKVNATLILEKMKYENNMQDLREKKQQGKAKWLIEKAENLLEESKDDYKYSQGSQRKYMDMIKSKMQQRSLLVASINSPIRPIMNVVAEVERVEFNINQLRLKLNDYKNAATDASAQLERDSKIAEDLQAAAAGADASDPKMEEAMMKADKKVKESRDKVKGANANLVRCLVNISNNVQVLNSTNKRVNDMTFDILSKLRRIEQVAERKMIETSRKLKMISSYVKSGKYEMNKAKVNLASAKRSGNTNEAQKQADLVQSWAEKVGDRIDKEKIAQDAAKNASMAWQNAQNQTNAFESFYKSHTVAAEAQTLLTNNLMKERTATMDKKTAEDLLVTAEAALLHAAKVKKSVTSNGLGYKVGYGSLSIDSAMSTAIRLKEEVTGPANIKVTVDRKEACSNQFVVLARKPTFHWPIKKGEEAIALRFACNFKATDGAETVKMISGYKKKPIAFAKCSSDDKVIMNVKIHNGYVTFKDNAGCSDITTPLPFLDEPFYVFVGAAKPKTAARIVNFELMKPEMPPRLKKSIVMFDDFDFHDDIWKPQWTIDETKDRLTNGAVDKYCGSATKADGNSMRMFHQGKRIATTKVMDVSYGGELTFFLRFGGENGTTAMCAPMMDREDAVVLEFCTRDCFKPQGDDVESENEGNFLETGATPGERTVKTIAGRWRGRWKKRLPVEDTSVNAKLAVVCCSDNERRVNSDKYGCHPRKSYFEAIDICRNKGLRLCTLEEAKQCRTCGTKCGFNRKRVWTSSGEVKVQEKDPVDDDTPMVPHNKTKVYPGGWEQLSKFTVAEDGDRLSRGFVAQRILLDYDHKYVLSDRTQFRVRQLKENNDPATNMWALDDIKIDTNKRPVRPRGQPRTVLVNDKFDGDQSDRFNMAMWWWDMWRTTGRTDGDLVGGYGDKGQSLTFGGNVSHSTWQIAQTPSIDTMSEGGLTLAFYLKFGRKGENVSEAHRGVELQYSLDGPDGEFKLLKSWMDVTKFDKWTRQLVQIDNCSTPEVMSNNTIFRFMLARNEEIAANSWHDIWAIDNFQALVGEHRIGWETGDLVKRDDSLFCYQEPRQLTPYKYDYVEDEDGGIAFSGDGTGRGSLRAHSSFQTPLSISSTIVKDDECSNHYIAISPEKYYTFSWDREPNTFKFVWRCDRKVLITPYSSSSTQCADFKSYKIRMRVTHEGVEFKDDGGCMTLRADIGMQQDTDFYVYFGAVQKGDESRQTDRVMTDNTGPQHNLTELRLEKVNATLEYNESEADDINNLNDTNAPELDTASRITTDKVHKDNMDNIKAWKAKDSDDDKTSSFLQVSPMSCSRALADTCGKVLGNMCLECYKKNAKSIVVKADGLVCDLKTAKSICAVNAHLDKTIVPEEEGHKEVSKRSGRPARFISMKIGDVGSFINKFNSTSRCPRIHDCGLSPWGRWGKCNKVCGDGISKSYRYVIRPPKYGGLQCPDHHKLVRERPCNIRSCDCHVTPWDDWSCCTQQCADPKYDPPQPGTQFSTRRVVLKPLRNGMACPGLNKSRTCNEERCAAVGIPPLGQTKKFLNMTKFEPFVAPNHDDFCFQDQSTLGSYKYDYVSKNDPTGEKFGIFFTGDGRGEGSLRSKKSFRASDLEIEAKLDKNSRCANHWIALSPDEYFTWNYEQEPRAIKAGWFCDYKFLITPRGNYSTKCNRIRNYNVSLKVKGNTVVFEDDQCGKLTGSVDMRPEYLDVYAFIGADHLAGNETIILAKPLTLEELSALEDQRGTLGPEGGSDDGSQRHIMTKSDMAQLEANLTQGNLTMNSTNDDEVTPDLDNAVPRRNGPISRVMTTNKFTGKKENEKDPQAKKFREADPGKVWEGAQSWLIHNVYRGTLTSDFLAGATLYRYNGTNWEKTDNPLPPEMNDEYIASDKGWPAGSFIKDTDVMEIYAAGPIVSTVSPTEMIVQAHKYTGKEVGARGSSEDYGGIFADTKKSSSEPMKGLMDSDHYNNGRGGKDDSDSEKYESLFIEKAETRGEGFSGMSIDITDAAQRAAHAASIPGKTQKTIFGNVASHKGAPVKDTPVTRKMAVRCCWNKNVKLSHELYGCHARKTYSEAKDICENKGFRLCTVSEVQALKPAGTGCGFDNRRIWTASNGEDGDEDVAGEGKTVDTGAKKVKTIAGNGINENIPEEDTPISERLAVRCCHDSKTKIPMQGPGGYGCHRLKTFDEAEQICNRKGYRMCSLQEVKEGRVKGTGCGMDSQRIWTDTGLRKEIEGECLIVESGKGHFFRGTDLSGKRLCCTPKAKLNKRTGACTDPDTKEVCYLYGNDLMSTTPHPCDSLQKLTGWKLIFKQTVEKDFRGSWQRTTVGADGKEIINKGENNNCAPNIDWFKNQILDSGLNIEEYMFETAYNNQIKSQAVGKTKEVVGDEMFFGGVKKDDRGLCLKNMKVQKPYGNKVTNAQISYGMQKDSSGFCNYRTGKSSVNSYMIANAGRKDTFAADYSFFQHRNDPGSFSICGKNEIFNNDNSDKTKRTLSLYVRGKPEVKEQEVGQCPGGAMELKDKYGESRFCNKNNPCPTGYTCDVVTNTDKSVCCSMAVAMNGTTAVELDGRLPIPGEPEKNYALFTMLRISGPGTLINKDDGSRPCPGLVDCKVSGWGKWDECTAPCNGGNKTRHRLVVRPKEHGGRACPALAQTTFCNLRSCDCGVTQFSPWSTCSKDCGAGMTSRSRRVFREPLGDGAVCPHLNETEVCNNRTCPFIGLPQVGLSDLALENSKAEVFRGRDDKLWCYEQPEMLRPYQMGYSEGDNIWFSGNGSARSSLRSRTSFQAPLRIDLEFDRREWCDNHWIVLTTDPYYTFNRESEPDAIKFIYNCETKYIKTEMGNMNVTCPLHLEPAMNATLTVDEYGFSSFADNTCPGISYWDSIGKLGEKDFYVYLGADRNDHAQPSNKVHRTTFRSVRISGEGSVINNVNGTTACPGRKDCRVSAWGPFTNCTAPCDGGNHTRYRTVVTPAENGGRACPALSETRPCNTQRCGKDCIVNEWSEWGNCTEPCGGGIQWRVRSIFSDRINGSHFGKEECPALKEERKCNTQHCGRDCVVEPWSKWSKCSAPCGGGVAARTRKILHHPIKGSHHGKACPALEELKPCNTQKCNNVDAPTPITEDDVCAPLSGHCGRCTANPKCGYCPGTGSCMLGTVRGPTPRWKKDKDVPDFMNDPQKAFMYATNCSAWSFSYCTASSCADYKGCGDCLKDQFCGWCPSTGKCMEGDAAGSTEIGGYCPRGWLHSPLHSQFGADQRYDSLLSPTQKKVQEGHLHDYCSANTMETKMMIAEKMQEEKERQEKLRKARETCLPCAGTWPNCECGGNVQALKNRDIKKLQVTRAHDEADGVDQTLPRNDTIKSLLNYGKPALGSGSQCSRSAECSSNFCVGGFCCTKETNGCSKHGVCNSGGNCVCEQGWFGEACDSDTNTSRVPKLAQDKLERQGINVTELEAAISKGDAATVLKAVHGSEHGSEHGSDVPTGANLDAGEDLHSNNASSSRRSQRYNTEMHQDYKNANADYVGAVEHLGQSIDDMASKKQEQVSAEASAIAREAQIKLERQKKMQDSKKSDLKHILRQIDATTDDVAKGKLKNDADALKDSIDKTEATTSAMEASLKEKLRVSSDSAKKVAEDLASKAEKAKDMLQIAQQKEKSQEMNQANKFLQERAQSVQ